MLGFSPLSDSPLSSLPSGITNYSDILSTGAYTYTGIAVNDVKTSASISYADTLLVGTYTYTGKTVTDLFAHNDTLSKGTYTYTGVNATDLLAKNDTLSKGTYTYTGVSVNDVVSAGSTAYADTLLVGTYSYTGLTVTDSKAIADALSTGSYSLVGKTVVDVLAKNDNLAKGTYSLVGKDITDVKTGVVAYTDSLSVGTYTLLGVSANDDYISATESKGAGSYGKTKKNYIIKKDNQLLVFQSKQEAVDHLNNDEKLSATSELNALIDIDISETIENEPQVVKQALQPVYNVNAMLSALKANAQAEQLLNDRKYQALLAMYEQYLDEEDIEILLLAA